jgi:unsaturated chondroitin disaccharide hydrolase
MKNMNKIGVLACTVMLLMVTLSCNTGQKKTHKQQFNYQKALDYCIDKNVQAIQSLNKEDGYPKHIGGSSKHWECGSASGWTSGFWPGILWYAYEASNNASLKERAEFYTDGQKIVMEYPVKNHDLGFMLYCSYGNGYRLTNNPEYKTLLLKAADSLATLYNPTVGTILSWPAMVEKKNWPHNTIIDNMMNLELLFWAAKNGGNQSLYDMAVKHAETTMKYHIRPDSTTYHVAVYNDTTGEFIKGVTHQGYADESVWARGQAWGIYGYTMCYRETGKIEFLETAKMLADAYLKRLPKDLVPYWDFNDPEIPNAPRDASAAAISTSALLELSTLIKDKTKAEYYKSVAINTLKSLYSEKYMSNDKNDAFLLHSTGHKPKNSEVDVSIIYADYYFIEALTRLKKISMHSSLRN